MLGLDADISTINTVTIPALEAALARQLAQANTDIATLINTNVTALVDRLVSEVSNVVNGALQGVQSVASKATVDLNSIVDKLDGAAITVTINLAKPK